jgi:magnesium transporter
LLRDWLDPRVLTLIEEPSRATRVHIFSDQSVLNLAIPRSSAIDRADYTTFIVSPNALVSISAAEETVLQELEEETSSRLFNFQWSLARLLYYMISEVLQRGVETLAVARGRVKALSQRLDEQPDEVRLPEIVECKRVIGELADTVEDQFRMLGFVPTLDWKEETAWMRQESRELVGGFAQLRNSMERLEEKVNALHSQYQLVLHEKGNRRLNVLTIVQSIFVPLSLVAGIYGMNFDTMPELHWRYGYFVVLGLMVVVGLSVLWWFKREGWFD